MKKGRYLLNLILTCLAFSFPVALLAQVQLNADSLFLAAHEKAVDGKYEDAIDMANQILEKYPYYTDVRIFKARTLAWGQNFDAAIREINKVLLIDELHLDANIALCDFYLWSGKYESTIIAANKALNFYPYKEAFLLKKAQAELELKEYDNTRKTIQLIHDNYPNNQQAKDIDELIEMRSWKDEVRFEHYLDFFDQPYKRRWHMSSFGYGHNTPYGVFYGKIYFGDMINPGEKLFSSEVSRQYALELYPKFNKNNYMFINYSYSPDELFPENRAGLEYYHVFKNKFEISLGYRYLQFTPDNDPDVNINIYTGSIARYMGNWWISTRPYVIDDGQDISYRYSLEIRKFFKPEISYLELSVGTGTSPDDPTFYTGGAQRALLDSWRVNVEWKQRISRSVSFEIEPGYENVEYQKDSRRDQFTLRTSLSFLF